ncbi:LacI family DNA-binding transcriptional regulator [Ferroacidibacillus organovorans]|uniref:LacI family transcriptional regulator n=1 Tax=Ferroacidibacillus organovorans TaxID=1765683 RepID=A0A168C329_9BACL|nr:LacI family DNA-binding transcriptional regulator [Ferroacidibacillus organovorans]KYP81503.1 hypothetical protein AYJ22_07165 [Ferroacidibacillus organovorans]OAG94063.1 hypothetical protein AYW79_07480 [Ferroacidibacillus organovorans]OPG16860.1 LacI family transcriptional regulator [Ferroacidibacillus organovorans]
MVAEHAGVSIPTVSRVLNSPDRVREETKQKVLDVVRTLGFYPNENARRLRTHEVQAIGVIVPHIRDFFFSEIYKGMSEAAEAAGVQIFLHDALQRQERLYEGFPLLKSKGCSGVILVSAYVSRDFETWMSRAGIPVVLALTESETGAIPAFKVDDVQASFDAVAHLITRGHRRIGIISGPDEDPTAGRNRLQGYQSALRHYNIPLDPALIAYGAFRFEHGYEGMSQLLLRQGDEPLTAVYAVSDEMAVGAARCLYDRGIRVPEDVSVVGFDNIRLASLVTPTLTTVAQPFEEIGSEAVVTLLDMIHQNITEQQKGTRYLPHRIVTRESTRFYAYDSS